MVFDVPVTNYTTHCMMHYFEFEFQQK